MVVHVAEEGSLQPLHGVPHHDDQLGRLEAVKSAHQQRQLHLLVCEARAFNELHVGGRQGYTHNCLAAVDGTSFGLFRKSQELRFLQFICWTGLSNRWLRIKYAETKHIAFIKLFMHSRASVPDEQVDSVFSHLLVNALRLAIACFTHALVVGSPGL